MFPVTIYGWWLKICIEKWISKHVHLTPKASDAFKATLDFTDSICSFVRQRLEFSVILRCKETEGFLLPPLVMRFPPWERVSAIWVTLRSSFVRLRRRQCRHRGRKLCSKLVKDHWANGYMPINIKLKTNIHKRQWLHDRTLEHGERLSSRHFIPCCSPIIP